MSDGQHHQTVGQWEQYFAEHEFLNQQQNKDQDERTQKADGGANNSAKHGAEEERPK